MKLILIIVLHLILAQTVFCGEEWIKEEHAIAIRQGLGTLNGLLGSLLGLLTGLLGVSPPQTSNNNCLLGLGTSGNGGLLGGLLGGGGSTGGNSGSLGGLLGSLG